MEILKVVGLMIARDEAVCCTLTIKSIVGLVDELVFVDNSSQDGTPDKVRRACSECGISLHSFHAPLSYTVEMLRAKALEEGKKLKPDWFFTCDADMVFKDAKYLRDLAENGGYDQYFFETLNIAGGRDGIFWGSLNDRPVHLWMYRNHGSIYACANYICPEDTHRADPNRNRFLGWNLNGFKYYDHTFWRYQIYFSRLYNRKHGTNLSVDDYIKRYFGGNPGIDYQKRFVLNRIIGMCHNKFENYSKARGIPWEKFENEYLDFNDILKEWVVSCPFLMIIDSKTGEVMGRHPDLVGVEILPDSKFDQLMGKIG
ncbi:hypothetical protein KKF82_06175 [Patescibacteria group bacterium]|nr:hypothetical protein [Patescibacteria group bacterium]